jgi:hypothetical protein
VKGCQDKKIDCTYLYDTITFFNSTAPAEGKYSGGVKFSHGLSSWGVLSTTDFTRAIAPSEISNVVQDSTRRSNVVLAISIRLRATPIWAPLVVPFRITARAMTPTAMLAMSRSRTILSHRCRQRSR